MVLTIICALLLVLISRQFGSINRWGEDVWNSITNKEPAYYTVISVTDGDTLRVDINGDSTQVRLVGIDTPETNHPSEPVQCFGKAATNFLTTLALDQQVRLIADPLSDNKDQYNRLLRHVYLRDGTHVNAEIIKQGYGFAYVRFPLSVLDEFRLYELQARQNEVGLWDQCDPQFESGGYYTSNPASESNAPADSQ